MDTRRRGSALIFEPSARGHTREWIAHLASELEALPQPPSATFAVPREIAQDLAGRAGGVTAPYSVIEIGEGEVRRCVGSSPWHSGLARWRLAMDLARQAGAAHVHFLELDHLTLPLALRRDAAGVTVSGVLFRPSTHYQELLASPPRWRERMRDWRKDLLYRLSFGNPALTGVLSLDPYFPAFARRHYPAGSKVTYLPDPAMPDRAPAAAETMLADLVPWERKLFACFGAMSQRKGILELCDALALLREESAHRIAIVLAGRIEESLADEVHRRVAALQAGRRDLWIHLEDRHIGEGELAALVRRSEVILAPYQRFVGSSGVLMWAARAGVPLVAQEYGLVGDLVRRHRMGITTDTSSPAALAAAISRAAALPREALCDRAGMAAFAAGRTPRHFAQAIVGHLRARPGVAAADHRVAAFFHNRNPARAGQSGPSSGNQSGELHVGADHDGDHRAGLRTFACPSE
jgi:glycosyltransferase involved in cell wall biosynthesis